MVEVIHSYKMSDFHRSGVQIKETANNAISLTLICGRRKVLGNELQSITLPLSELHEIKCAITKMQKALDSQDSSGNIEE